jgi:hypothetical protein
MPTGYDFALFLHLLGVFAIAGAAVTELVCMSMMRRANTVQDIRPWASVGGMIEKIFPVAAIVLLLTGGYMTGKLWDWGDGWINVSATALIVGAIAGFAIDGRRVDAISSAAETARDGAIPADLAARTHDPILFGTAHALILMLLGIIWNMTTKPGDAQAGIVVVIAVLVGAASAYPMVARQQRIAAGDAASAARTE